MREELFKMERKGLVSEGQQVNITERVNGSLYSYLVEPSVAMSGIYRSNQRIKSDTGIINEIRETERGFYLVVGFDERPVEDMSLKTLGNELIEKVLRKHGGNRKAAAAELGISERTLYRRLKK